MAIAQDKNKLTLWLDKETINFGKRFAQNQRKSLSEVIKEYLQALRKGSNEKIALTPTIKRMTGVIKSKKVSIDDYHQHLEKKYLNA